MQVLASVDGGGYRLFYFVRQRGSQFSHGGHPVDVPEVHLRLTQLLFGLLPVLNLNPGSIPLDDAAQFIAQRHLTDQQPAISSICHPDPYFTLHRLPSHQGCAPVPTKLARSSECTMDSHPVPAVRQG